MFMFVKKCELHVGSWNNSVRKIKSSYFYVDQDSRNCLCLSKLQKVCECHEFTLVLGFRVPLVASILSKRAYNLSWRKTDTPLVGVLKDWKFMVVCSNVFKKFTLQGLYLAPCKIKWKYSLLFLNFGYGGRARHEGRHRSSIPCQIGWIQTESYSIFWHLDWAVYYVSSIIYCLLISEISATRIHPTCSIVSYDQSFPCKGTKS